MNTKRKITPLSDKSIGYRRSSLQVNLSCVSNLTDSGNESFNDSASANKAKYIGDLRSNSNEMRSRVPLRNPSVLLERINRDDAMLHKSCKQLRTAILMKTKQMFHERSELSVKTSNILNDRGVQGRYRKRRLFVSTKESTNNHVPTDEYPNNKNVSSNTLNKLVMSGGTRTCATDNFNRFKDESISNSSIHEDTFTATPIACSTMINENNDVSCAEGDAQFPVLNSSSSVSKMHTKPSITSMEVTNVCEGFILCDKTTSSLKRVKKGTSLVEERNDEKFQRLVSDNETESTNTEKTSLNVNTSVDSVSKPKDNEHNERDSTNTVRTSLRMNTSLNISRTMQENIHGNKSSIDSKNGTSNVTGSDNYFHHENIEEKRKLGTNEQSRIEATPYPMYRSVMLRSQLKQNARSRSSRYQDESTKDSNVENVKKPCKKRLMPLNEHSQISLSPAEKHHSPPRYLPFRRKLIHRKSNGKITKNEQNEGKTRNKKKGKNVKKIVVKKIVDQEILNNLQENTENLDKSPVDTQRSNRNSFNDFRSFEGSSATKRYKSKKKRTLRISIVTTGLSNDDKSIVRSVVKALGCATIETNVTKRTTHVVTTGVRTINLLHAIIRGCWIVGLEWVLKSLENDAWLNPQQYEMKHFSNAVLENRKDRQLFGSSYVPELFAACGYIHIENNTTPPCDVLKDLVKTAGGCITENPQIAKVVIGREGLKETWVFDCITSGELQPYDHYVRS
nr:PREDICTED: uncharacterized protein LOC100882860 isoform X1 [Megachile rotundata]